MVASLATMTQSRPHTCPMPVTMPAEGDVAAVHVVRGERRQLQERAAGIEQRGDAVAHQELAALGVARARLVAAAARRLGELVAQVIDRRRMASALRAKSGDAPSMVDRERPLDLYACLPSS